MADKAEFTAADLTSVAKANDAVPLNRLFLAWLRIGFTSFGGGAVTTYLIQEHFIYKRKWITEEEYTRILAMCQITPGMNIIAYTILIGKQLGGWGGIFVSLAGLILPSAAITVGMAALYAGFSKFSRAQGVLRAVFAAIFGVALTTNWRNIRPILASNRRRGPLALTAALGILTGSAVIYIVLNPPVVVLYLLGGFCGALTYWHVARKAREH